MSYTINFSKQMSGILHPNPNMLKSTKEKMERQSERDSKVAFFEAQKENLKNMKTETVEDIAKKLEMFHTYEDEIAAAKQEYNSSQMFHIMDEAEEEAEKRAKEAEKNKPKTEEERKEEAVDEALGTDDDKGMLAENMEKLSEITDQMTEEMTGDLTENIEALPTEKAPEETAEKELSGQKLSTKELSTEEKLQQDAIEKKAYHTFDMRALESVKDWGKWLKQPINKSPLGPFRGAEQSRLPDGLQKGEK